MPGAPQTARVPALRMLPAIVLCGLALGVTEGLWHRFGVQPGPGYPGHGGASVLAHAFLNLAAISLPALMVGILSARFRHRFWGWLVWAVGLAPTCFVLVDLVVHTRELDGFALAGGGLPHLLRLAPLVLAAVLVGVVVGSRLGGWLSGRLPRAAVVAAVVLSLASPAVTAFLLRAPARPAVPGGSGDRPNVVLFTIDTLRLDAVGAFGGPPTPHLDRWIRRGVASRGWTPASWTRPAFGALFSGLPTAGNGGEKETRIYPGVDWWPERLAEAGYVTQAFVTNPNLFPRYGFERGFAGWDHSEELEGLDPVIRSAWAFWWTRRVIDRGDPRRGDKIVDRALAWLRDEARDLDAPWFLWVHLMDPHLPYHLRGDDGELHDDSPPAWWSAVQPALDDDGAFHALIEAREGTRATDPDVRAALKEMYLSEVRFADAQAGRLWSALEQVEEPTLWVITSDHGEEFWEHGGFEHGHALHDEVLRVPFALGGAGIAPGWMDDMRLQDVGPTVLALLDLPPLDLQPRSGLTPAESDLIPFTLGLDRSQEVRTARAVPPACAAPRLLADGMLYGPSQTRWILPDGRSWIRDDERDRWSSAPLCTATQAPTPLPEIRALTGLLEVWRLRTEERATPVDLDPTLLESLRAVGYLR